jgi:hypothetical protein
MLGIVAPVATSPVPAANVGAVPAINVCAVPSINIGVAIEVIEVVDGHIIAAPSTAISPAASPKGPHGHTDAK